MKLQIKINQSQKQWDLNSAKIHFWSKFGKPHFIWYWLIARTNSQAKNGVNFDFQVQFDLEDHRQSPHKTTGILIKVFYISDPNLVILAWTVDELSHGQAHNWRTDTHTHTHAGLGQNWPRVKRSASNSNQGKIIWKIDNNHLTLLMILFAHIHQYHHNHKLHSKLEVHSKYHLFVKL